MEITWRVISGEGGGGNGEEGTGNKKHKWQVQSRQGEVKNSIGNGEAKEFLCMIHGHELSGEGIAGGRGGAGWRRIKGRKKWKNCNSIINKMYFLNSKKSNSAAQKEPQIWSQKCHNPYTNQSSLMDFLGTHTQYQRNKC